MTNNNARRTAMRTGMKLLLAGSVISVGTACNVLQSLPRNTGGSTDGTELALRVHKALREHAYTSLLNVSVSSSSEDTVIVKGLVYNQSDIDNIDLVAHQVEGVRHAQIDVYLK